MALELYYTSSPRGLRPGTSGLCTVAMTRSMSVALASRLESLCGYRPPGDGVPIERWPLALSHWTIDIGGVERHVLAAVRPVRPDHTMRSNTLAHFAVLHPSELDPAGAAWMLAQPETSAVSWSGEPRLLDAERAMPRGGPADARACSTWASVAGDAGWAGVLANAAMLDPTKPATVICPMGAPVLDMVSEAMSLLPAAYRWRITFTTYFTQPIAGVRCTWRFCLDGTSAATAARQSGGLVIDASAPHTCTRTGEFVDAARAGRAPALASPTVRSAVIAKPTPGRSAPAADGPIPLERDGSPEGEHRWRTPSRRPVGMDEPAPAVVRSGRTALAVAVVTAVALLAIVAVLAVLMRTMSAEIVDLQGRVAKAEEERDSFRAAGEESETLRQQRDDSSRQLADALAAVRALEAWRTDAQKTIADQGTQLKMLRPAAPAPSAAGTPPAPEPDEPAPPGPQAQQPSGGSSAPQSEGASDAQAEPSQDGGSIAATSVRRSQVVRGQAESTQSTAGVQDMARDSAIEAPRAPALASSAGRSDMARIAWPALAGCAVSTASLGASSAIESIGFAITDGTTLVMHGGEVAMASVDDSGITWTWDLAGATKAATALGKQDLKTPESWSMITSQVKCHAQCADGTSREAWLGKPRMRKWTVAGNGSDRFDVTIPGALARAAVIGWGGHAISLVGGGSAETGAGTVTARKTGTVPTEVSAFALGWAPSVAEQETIACAERFQAGIAEERKLSDLERAVSQWIGALATPPTGVALKDDQRKSIQAGYAAWRVEADRNLTQAARTQFAEQPLVTQLTAYRNWLRDSRIEPMRQQLTSMKAECDTAMQSLREQVSGSVIAVHLCPDGPPIELVELSVAPRDLSLPWTGSAARGGSAP